MSYGNSLSTDIFDVMSHLPLHLVDELIILGPVQVRWMYPIERNMMTLKNHVKNRARLEASIAHGYLLSETMGFATSYMHGFDAVRRRVWDADPEDREEFEVLEGAPVSITLTRSERDAIHRFVLRNNTLTAPYYRYDFKSFNCFEIVVGATLALHPIQNLQSQHVTGTKRSSLAPSLSSFVDF